jgi:hypothetical protein
MLKLFEFIFIVDSKKEKENIVANALSRIKHKFMDMWYVQNISTFLNTFAIVSPLICLFWIQLTRNNVVFSRIALMSCFCAEIRHLGKILENTAKFLFYQKKHGARIQDGGGGHEGLTPPGGAGQARPRQGVVWPPRPSPRPLPLPTYTF